ncbi:MAG: hypothetical protein H6659_07380 [Ardenticatenaceae bacterium]|nr:hypothetical protein [Ardenticatenaceae bacterium]
MARPLETLTTRTLLGIRFWDPATDRQISDGLQVSAAPETAPDLKVNAFRTASGNFAFQNLPGMRAYEYPAASEDLLLSSPPAPRPFIVTATDSKSSFMPVRFRVELPLLDSSLYQPAPLTSPLGNESARFYLFSAPARPTPPGLAAIRATLTSPDNETPAAYALLEIAENGRRWYGLTDARGCATILFPYPTFITALGASPPGLPPAQQHWPLTLRVRHDPGLISTQAPNQPPTIRQIRNQPTAALWPTVAGPPTPTLSLELTYGRELILQTSSQSNLWIGPAPP